MKLKMRKIAIASLLAACCMIGGVSTLSVSANETVYVNGNIAVNGFKVSDGASILMKEDYAGIRFETRVTNDFMTYLYDTYGDTEDGTTYEWHTLITGTNMLPNDAVTDVTPDLTKAEIGKDTELACQNFTLAPTEEANGVYYRAAILYYGENWENLSEAQKASIYSAELIARSYVEITPSGATESTIIYASANDTVRSMKQVACTSIAREYYKICSHTECEGYTQCQAPEEVKRKKALLYNYVGAVATNETAYYSEKDASGVIGNLTSGVTYKAYMNGALLENVTATNNGLSVSGITTTDYTIGNDFEVLLVGNNATLTKQPIKYVSDIITTAAELQAIVPGASYTLAGASTATTNGDTSGYYVLGNDIDLSANACGFAFMSATLKGKFTGTFDGCGYAIKNYTVSKDDNGDYRYGLFGILETTTTVKNFALVDAKLVGSTVTLLGVRMLATKGGARASVAENIYVDMDITAATFGWGLFYNTTTNSENAIIKNVVVESTVGNKVQDKMGIIIAMDSRQEQLYQMENVHVISSETRIVYSKASYTNYMAVSKTDYDAFIEAGKVTVNYKTGSKTYDLTVTDGVATFDYSSTTMTLICLDGVTSYADVTAFGDKQVGSWKYDATAGAFVYQN